MEKNNELEMICAQIYKQYKNLKVLVSELKSKLSPNHGKDILDRLETQGLIRIQKGRAELSSTGEVMAHISLEKKELGEDLGHELLFMTKRASQSVGELFQEELSEEGLVSLSHLLKNQLPLREIIPIPQLQVGQWHSIYMIAIYDLRFLEELKKAELIPFKMIKVLQKSSYYLLQTEKTQLMINHELAGQIFVRKSQI